jgi:hypothetical protein
MDRGWTRIPKRPGGGADLGARYEAVRAAALAAGGSRAGLGAALLIAQGMAAWIRSWRACTPPPPPARPGSAAPGPPAEVVGVLAAMALAGAPGG